MKPSLKRCVMKHGRRVQISKPDGGVCELGIPTVTDRLIQQALQPRTDPMFSEHSDGFLPGRRAGGPDQAL